MWHFDHRYVRVIKNKEKTAVSCCHPKPEKKAKKKNCSFRSTLTPYKLSRAITKWFHCLEQYLTLSLTPTPLPLPLVKKKELFLHIDTLQIKQSYHQMTPLPLNFVLRRNVAEHNINVLKVWDFIFASVCAAYAGTDFWLWVGKKKVVSDSPEVHLKGQ